MPRTLRTPLGPPAVEALARVVREAKGQDPLAPVTVAVPSGYAGLSLRRTLGARPGGVVNVRFLPLARVVELLAAPALAAAGRRPLTPAVLGGAVRTALEREPGVFAPVAGHPATERALRRALVELRACSATTLDALAAAGPRAASLVRLHRIVRALVEAEWYDEHDLAEEAREALGRRREVPADLGHVVVFCPRGLPPSFRAFVAALGGGATVLEADVDGGHPPAAHLVVACPDPDEEVHEAVRLALERATATPSVPLHRMAILHPPGEPYARIVHQHLAAAGIAHNGPAVRTLAQTVPGACLLGLLRLGDGDFRRDDVAAWLTSAPVLLDGSSRRAVPAARWDLLTRRAGVVAGRRQWDERVVALATALRSELADSADDVQRQRALQRDVELLDQLHVFAEELLAAARPPEKVSWSERAAWACGLLRRYLGDDDSHGWWPEAERDAWRRIWSGVGALASLDGVCEPPDAATFRRAVEEELSGPAGRTGVFGDGIFVGPLSAAVGADFDVVFVLGLAEGTLPGRAREDTLLPDADRVVAGRELPSRAEREAEQRSDYLAALLAGRERILLWPRGDLRRGRARLPSRWLLDTATALRGDGRRVFGDDLLRMADDEGEPRVRQVSSFESGLRRAPEPASLLDHDLQSLLLWTAAGGQPSRHFLVTGSRTIAAGFAAVADRTGAAFTRFDGNLAGLPVHLPDGAVSASSLETYATCPMRWFLAKQLRLSIEERPEDILSLRALDKGALVHAVLEDYVRTLLAGEPRSLDRLLALAERRFAEVEASGATGRQLLWKHEREVMRRELTALHRVDDLEPLAAELAFGEDGRAPVVLELPSGGTVSLRGRADRVDRDNSGRLVVTDYKTGSPNGYTGIRTDPVLRGTRLQLPLYALAARQAFPSEGAGAPVRSRYWFASERGRFEQVEVEVTDQVLERFTAVVDVLVDGMTAGAFPARPGEADHRGGWANCRHCDFDRLCQADRDRQWERKRRDAAVRAYQDLAEGGDG